MLYFNIVIPTQRKALTEPMPNPTPIIEFAAD